jgi:hypothetical protein
MRAAEILAAVPDLPPDIVRAIFNLDARAYQSNEIPTLNDLQLHARLTEKIKAFGSARAAARAWNVTPQTLHCVLNGDRPCPPAILIHLGLKRVPPSRVLFREVWMNYPVALHPQLQPKLDLAPPILVAIEANGWTVSHRSNDTVYFAKPRLQLSVFFIRGEFKAYIAPRERTFVTGGPPIDPAEFIYRFEGRGAKAQARNAAIEMIREHFGYLAAVGVQLISVYMELWSGSGRGGGYWEYAYNPRAMPECENLFS